VVKHAFFQERCLSRSAEREAPLSALFFWGAFSLRASFLRKEKARTNGHTKLQLSIFILFSKKLQEKGDFLSNSLKKFMKYSLLFYKFVISLTMVQFGLHYIRNIKNNII